MKWHLIVVVLFFIVLHNDFWWWQDTKILFGLPIGLTFHIIYCVAGSLLLYVLIRFTWPGTNKEHSATEEDQP